MFELYYVNDKVWALVGDPGDLNGYKRLANDLEFYSEASSLRAERVSFEFTNQDIATQIAIPGILEEEDGLL